MPSSPAHRTLADYTYNELRSAILEGRLQPGARLDQAKICVDFGVSRTPLREVLQRLESEGLVTIRSHRGAVVAKLELREIQEIYEARAVLEAYAAGQSTKNWTSAGEAELKRLVRRMASATPGSNPEAVARTHFEFHLALYRGCANTQMVRLIEDLMRKCDWYRRASLSQPHVAAMSLDRHREIFEAYRARDADLVISLVRRNLATSEDRLPKAVGDSASPAAASPRPRSRSAAVSGSP